MPRAAEAAAEAPRSTGDLDVELLERIQERVLWLAVRIVDYANNERSKQDAVKVGGHQASSASMVSLMTALWFGELRAADRVSVKPHASPVLHAIEYLLGRLDRRHLTELRAFGGLQPYPSRTKDPFPVDYSTGSVGLGATAPLFGAVAMRYLSHHFEVPSTSRFVALIGDAELDEGNVWEAIADPVVDGLDNVLWVVDLNRQSLDRVVPGVKAARLKAQFAANGWKVVEAKYGRRLQQLFAQRGGGALRRHIDSMSNEAYQSLFAARGADVRERFLVGADAGVKRLLKELPDDDFRSVVTNLGGHDLVELSRAFGEASEGDAPAVLFAYTVKGWGLPMAGDPLNHAAMLTGEQVDELRERSGLTRETEWDRFAPGSPEDGRCREVAARLERPARVMGPRVVEVPVATGLTARSAMSTQEAFGRVLIGLTRHDEVARRVVTVSPDVTVSTNLGGWVNKVGVFSPREVVDLDAERRLLRWDQTPAGRHLELGISEMNLFSLLGQLGLTGEMFGEPLVPVGTVYDPFVLRGLDAFVHALYSGSRFVVAGTPSGVTLSYEGGAHQSVVTASLGMELPGVTFAEPAYPVAVDWLLCDGVRRVLDPDGDSLYLRLSTRPVDSEPFERVLAAVGEERLRADVLAGGYRLLDEADGAERGAPLVHLVASGAVVPEVLAAAAVLADEGVAVSVTDVTSADRLFRDWRGGVLAAVESATVRSGPPHLSRLFPPAQRRAPIVTVHDASPHALGWLGSVFGVPVVPLGVERFGQAGSIPDVYRYHAVDEAAVVNAALAALDPPR